MVNGAMEIIASCQKEMRALQVDVAIWVIPKNRKIWLEKTTVL